MIMTPIEKAIEILGATHDGEDLSGVDLKLCETAANNRLTEAGSDAFNRLYDTVRSGQYDKTNQWLHGIPELTKTPSGYIKWKGTTIEHYTFPTAEGERAAAQNLAEHCQMLEAKGFPVTWRTATHPEMYDSAPAGTQWQAAILCYYTFFADKAGKAHSCILGFSGQGAVALHVADGQLHSRYVADADLESGAYLLFLALQDYGLISFGDRVRNYSDLVAVMEDIGLTPDVVNGVLAAGMPELVDTEPVPANLP